jgi:DNA-binding NarL/FixJ family response regulator
VLQQLTAPPVAARPSPELTDREFEVLDLLAAGQPIRAIAARIGIAPKTVSNVVSTILAKLQPADRAQAAVAARDAGLRR